MDMSGNRINAESLDHRRTAERVAVGEALDAASKGGWAMKSVFTTGEVAEICKISQQTVIRCFDSGKLQGFRVPGSKFRRVPRDALIAFMKANRIPLDQLDSGKKKVLVVDDDPDIVEMLRDIVSRDGRFEVRSASNGFDAGALTLDWKPDLMILDYMLPDINGNLVCERIRKDPAVSGMRIIIVSGAADPEEIRKLTAAGADDFIKKPFDVNHLIERMVALLQA